MTQRTQRHPYLGIFDAADPAISTAQRSSTTTPLQSLYLMNNPFVHIQATGLAQRLLTEQADNSARLDLAWKLTFSRAPQADETAAALTLLAKTQDTLKLDGIPEDRLELESWSALTRSLFRTNEFLYLD